MKYLSSKGPVEIDTMPLRYASNALAKLRAEAPERKEEIDALAAHVASIETAPPPAGDNLPPPDTATPKWDAVKVQMDDLLVEAHNWADGTKIASQDQADAVGRLRQLLQDAANLAEKARVAEKDPYDKLIAEIQDRYNEYTAPMKNKKPGTVSKAVTALGNLLTPWLQKLDDEKCAREDAAREVAEKAAQAALDARQEAKQSDSLAAMNEADSLLEAAEEAAKDLRTIEREKVQAKGEFRAIGLRSKWVAKLNEGEGGKALVHYAKAQPERVKAFLQELADEDVRKGARSIPGFEIKEEKSV